MSEFLGLLWIWFVHAAMAALFSAPVLFFGRHRVHWYFWEVGVFVLPFLVWWILMLSPLARGKSIANLGEPFYFSFAIPVAAILRVVIGASKIDGVVAAALLAAVCATAVTVFFVTPPLPE